MRFQRAGVRPQALRDEDLAQLFVRHAPREHGRQRHRHEHDREHGQEELSAQTAHSPFTYL
jgi:hypothetical protein